MILTFNICTNDFFRFDEEFDFDIDFSKVRNHALKVINNFNSFLNKGTLVTAEIIDLKTYKDKRSTGLKSYKDM